MAYRAFFILITGLFCLYNITYSQFDPNPELDFYTIETEHFYIHYHKGTERTAHAVAKIAEEIYGPITSLYNYKPSDKTSFIINDESDFSNGATDYYGNRIEIAAVALDFDLRGTHNWLRNVITHEFTHVIQVPAAMKFSKKMPSIYLQWLNYEDERRPDVLYGYPNVIASYPISGVGVPAWYAEGTAQYQRQQLNYDYWDAHRDMILRTRTLDNDLLSWEDMGQFASVTTYKAESIYNSGFGLVRYIAEKYGEDKLREITLNLGDPVSFNSESAFRKAIGKSGKELYNEWAAYLKQDYKSKTENLNKLIVDGEKIADIGFANYYPQFSPDGTKLSYLSNKTYDYGSTTLFVHKIGSKKDDEAVISSVAGSYAWTPDGKNIIFARRNKPTIHEKSIFDLYEYDFKTEEEEQITTNLRAHAPALTDDGKKIAFVINKDGTQNICIADYKQGEKIKSHKQLTSYNNGEQIYSMKWSPDGNAIVFDYSLEGERGISILDINTLTVDVLFSDEDIDYRNPVYSGDGKYIYFSSDATGIFNVYRYDLISDNSAQGDKRNSVSQMTNVIGGAFMPDVDKDGNLAFASFKSTGYKINLLKSATPLDSSITNLNAVYVRPDKLIRKYASENDSNSSSPKNKYQWASLKKFNDKDPVIKSKTSYNNVATPLFFIPVLRIDNYTKEKKFADMIKPGLYFYSQDVLGRMGIFGGASINRKMERDIFLQFEYNNGVPFFKDFFLKSLGFAPHFTLAGYNITRKTSAELVIPEVETIPIDITYDLLQFDFQMAFKIINSNHNMMAGFTVSRYSSKLGGFFLTSLGQQVPATSNNYFNGRDLSLTYSYANFIPNKHDDINPVGRYFKLKYDYEFNYLNPELVINEEGNVVEQFGSAKFHRLEGLWSESVPVFNTHSIGLTVKGGTIFGPRQDNFFDFYATGYPGMKGYPFYALGGNEYAAANLTYRFPLATGLDFKFLQFYFDKMYLSLYTDIGNAWNGNATKLKDFKKDVGAELRLQAYSYYVYPTSFAFNAAYGLDEFKRAFPSTTGEEQQVTYGKEWRFYFTMLFGFDFINDAAKRLKF